MSLMRWAVFIGENSAHICSFFCKLLVGQWVVKNIKKYFKHEDTISMNYETKYFIHTPSRRFWKLWVVQKVVRLSHLIVLLINWTQCSESQTWNFVHTFFEENIGQMQSTYSMTCRPIQWSNFVYKNFCLVKKWRLMSNRLMCS